MRYKCEKMNNGIVVCNGDALRLSFVDFDGATKIHEESFHTCKNLTHWLFFEIEDGIGEGVIVGDSRLESWFKAKFPDAIKVETNEALFT